MCGISAIFRFEGDAGADLADLDRMHRAQRHRGPDGEGAMVINRHWRGRCYPWLPVPGSERVDLRLIAAVRRLRISDLRALADQQTAKHYLPARVVASKEKRRFVLMDNWMPLRNKHAADLRDASRSTAWTKLGYVDAAKLRMFVDDNLAGRHEDGYAVWCIYTAWRWLDLFGL